MAGREVMEHLFGHCREARFARFDEPFRRGNLFHRPDDDDGGAHLAEEVSQPPTVRARWCSHGGQQSKGDDHAALHLELAGVRATGGRTRRPSPAANVAPEHGDAPGSSNRVPAWMGAPRSRSWTETQTRGVGKHDSKAMHVDGSAVGPSSNLHGSPRALRISDPA